MLDPADWEAFRAVAHRALDDAIDAVRDVRDAPAWQPVPQDVKMLASSALPQSGESLSSVYETFKKTIAPYPTGNVHPRFWGWVHGSGTPAGALADMLASFMNSNVGGRDHAAVYVERAVIAWCAQLFGFPAETSGILVSGSSLANFIAILAARTRARRDVSTRGLDQRERPLVGYTSSAAHGCIRKAFEMAGLGGDALRVVPVDRDHRLDVAALRDAIAQDRRRGARPFIAIATAGTVDVGAIDPIDAIADVARDEQLWLHVDGAFGAALMLAPSLREKLHGLARADSLAFDFHKWLHVPYDAGCVLIRDAAVHRAAFGSERPYLTRMPRGTGSGEPWFADFGPELSRSFRALKVWFTLRHYGTRALGAAVERNCAQARRLAQLVQASDVFELAAPVTLQIVCFRPRAGGIADGALDALTDEAVMRVQESGLAVVSSTTIGGRRAVRVCITNHRTRDDDVEIFMESMTRIVEELRSTPTA